MTKKKVIAIVVTTLALTAGSIGVAGAASKASQKISVTKSSATVAGQAKGPKGGPLGADRAAMDALVSATIGVDSATIKSRLQAGESLAQIAGTKKDALIAALGADETKRIDAAVTAGTLTAAQATELKANLVAHVTEEVNAVGGKGPFGKGPKGPKGGPLGADRAAIETLVSTTIGVDTATIKSRLQAGESLAQIAGAKKDALIAALVADETKRIDAAVTAGTLTAAQATELKANLVAHVTEEVNAVGGKGPFGKGPKGPKGDRDGRGGHGHDHRGPKGGGLGGATAPTLPTPTATTGA